LRKHRTVSAAEQTQQDRISKKFALLWGYRSQCRIYL